MAPAGEGDAHALNVASGSQTSASGPSACPEGQRTIAVDSQRGSREMSVTIGDLRGLAGGRALGAAGGQVQKKEQVPGSGGGAALASGGPVGRWGPYRGVRRECGTGLRRALNSNEVATGSDLGSREFSGGSGEFCEAQDEGRQESVRSPGELRQTPSTQNERGVQ